MGYEYTLCIACGLLRSQATGSRLGILVIYPFFYSGHYLMASPFTKDKDMVRIGN